MMPVDVSIDFPQADVDAMVAQMQRARKELGLSFKESVKWAGAALIRSLGASCKAIPKGQKRPLVDNPDPTAKTDGRKAKIGVMAWRKGKEVFVPIFRQGEYGGRGTRKGDRITEKTDWRAIQHPRREIPKKGFAKKSWGLLAGKTGRGGEVIIDGIPRIGSIHWTGGDVDPGIHITNRVKYMMQALAGGKKDVSTAMERASEAMKGRIRKAVEKQNFVKS
jgi:hypothetical protein